VLDNGTGCQPYIDKIHGYFDMIDNYSILNRYKKTLHNLDIFANLQTTFIINITVIVVVTYPALSYNHPQVLGHFM
jgi:hypothetical protein